jgi:hypothetical protein
MEAFKDGKRKSIKTQETAQENTTKTETEEHTQNEEPTFFEKRSAEAAAKRLIS